jgi:hypothetical protein
MEESLCGSVKVAGKQTSFVHVGGCSAKH